MERPTPDEMENAVAALLTFVHRWGLQLNPEHLYEIASAVLVHARSAESYEEIQKAVECQLDEFAARMGNLYKE